MRALVVDTLHPRRPGRARGSRVIEVKQPTRRQSGDSAIERSTKSQAVADLGIAARDGRLRHSATAKQYCPSSSTVARRQPRRRHVRAPKDLIQGLRRARSSALASRSPPSRDGNGGPPSRQLRRRWRCPSRWLAATATPVRLAPSTSVGLGQCVPPQPPRPTLPTRKRRECSVFGPSIRGSCRARHAGWRRSRRAWRRA
jgi:hypothetical protein